MLGRLPCSFRLATQVRPLRVRGTKMDRIEERFYEIAAQEVAAKRMVPGVFAKAFSDADGDEKKTIAGYIKLRVVQLHEEFEEELARRRAQEQAEKRESERRDHQRRSELAIPSSHQELVLLKKKAGEDAVVFAHLDGSEWVCSCGTRNPYNPKTEFQNCARCHRNRDFVLTNCSREAARAQRLMQPTRLMLTSILSGSAIC